MDNRAAPTHEPTEVVSIRPDRPHPSASTPSSPDRGSRFAPPSGNGLLPENDDNLFDCSPHLFESCKMHGVGEVSAFELDELAGGEHRRNRAPEAADADREAPSPLMTDAGRLLPIDDRDTHLTLRPGLHRRHQS